MSARWRSVAARLPALPDPSVGLKPQAHRSSINFWHYSWLRLTVGSGGSNVESS